MMKTKRKQPIAKRRVKAELPELYVKLSDGWRTRYSKASIRVKAGKYIYLAFRDGTRVRNFYLGAKRKP
jgi:hypothetical protein